VKYIIGVILILCLVYIPISSYGQADFQRFPANSYGFGAKLGFIENVTALNGYLVYGISEKYAGYLGAGLGFLDENTPGVSVPPTRAFGIGGATSAALAQTGLDFWSNIGFGVEFGKIVDAETDETFMTSRVMMVASTLGISKKIATESGIILYPLAGISWSYAWVTLEMPIQMYNSQDEKSGTMDFSETEGDDTWSGQIGLIVEVSPKMSINGIVGFSFENSDVGYTVGILFY